MQRAIEIRCQGNQIAVPDQCRLMARPRPCIVIDDEEPGAAEMRGVGRRLSGARWPLPKQRPDAEDHQVGVRRLRKIGVRAALQPLPFSLDLRRLGQHEQRDGARPAVQPDLARQFAAVHPRQMVIGDHEVRQAEVEVVERRLCRGRPLDLKAAALEHAADHDRLGFGILDHEQVRRPHIRLRHQCSPSGAVAWRIAGAILSSGNASPDAPSFTALAGIP